MVRDEQVQYRDLVFQGHHRSDLSCGRADPGLPGPWAVPVSPFLGVAFAFLAIAVFILSFRVSTLSWELNRMWDMRRLQHERLQEDIVGGLSTLRLDLGLPAITGYCGICLQWTVGDRDKHLDYCRFSRVSAIRDWKLHHPGEPLPEGVEDPDEQQQQGHRPVPGDPA